MRIFFSILLSLLISSVAHGQEPDGVTWQYDATTYTYTITHRVTNTFSAIAGTNVTLRATATWLDPIGGIVKSAESEPLTVTVGPVVFKKEWVYELPNGLEALLDFKSGLGGLEKVDANTLRVWVSIANDGKQAYFSWRMRLKGP